MHHIQTFNHKNNSSGCGSRAQWKAACDVKGGGASCYMHTFRAIIILQQDAHYLGKVPPELEADEVGELLFAHLTLLRIKAYLAMADNNNNNGQINRNKIWVMEM